LNIVPKLIGDGKYKGLQKMLNILPINNGTTLNFQQNRQKKPFPGNSIFNCRIKTCSLTFAAKFRPACPELIGELVEGRPSF